MPPSPAPITPAARRRVRPAVVLLLVVALLAGALATALWWTLRSEAGTAWLLQQVPGLRVTGPKGRLLGDFEAERIEAALPRAGVLTLEGAGWRGLRIERAYGQVPWRVVVERLYAARVDIQPGAPSGEPVRAPTGLGLPVEVVVEALEVQRLQGAPLGETAVRDLRARVHLGADGGARHRVDTLTLAVDQLRATGSLRIDTAGALPLQLQLALAHDAPLAGVAWSAQARLAGPLAAPVLTATLRARPAGAAASAATQSLDLDATLQPFEPWPLGDLQARAQALDLSALVSGAPVTALSGEARARTQARDQPAALSLSLANAAAGPWNEGRLPLRRAELTLRGRPDDPRRFELEALHAELGDARRAAGQVDGSGRWAPEGGSVDLVLKALQPARLDARAAAMELNGRVRLQGSIPAAGSGSSATTLDAQAELNGRLAGRGPARPVQLRLDAGWHADAGRQRLDLRRLLATAAGASASVSGRAERADPAAAWQLAGDLALVEFDPLPWWRGPEDSPWRRGPHRVNARGSFDVTLPAGAPPPAAGSARRRPPHPLGGLRGRAQLTLARSQLAGVPIRGEVDLRSAAGPATVALRLDADGNRFVVDGQVATRPGATDDEWDLSVDAPALVRLAPLWQLARGSAAQLAGSLRTTATLQGRWPGALATRGSADASALRVDTFGARRAELRWALGTRLDAPVEADLRLDGLGVGPASAETLQLRVAGTGRAHTLALRADSRLRPPAWTDALQAAPAAPAMAASGPNGPPPAASAAVVHAQGGFLEGGANAPAGWRGSLQQLEFGPGAAGAAPWLRTRDVGVELGWSDAVPLRVEVQPGRAEVLGAALRWSRIAWRAAGPAGPTQVEAKAELESFAIAPLLARIQPDFGWGGDLRIAGQLDVRSAPTFAADVVIERRGGDLTVTDEVGTQALGLTDLRLGLNAVDGTWSFTQALAGSTLGVAAGAVVARTSPSATWPAAQTPIEGVLELRVASLGAWGNWVPAGWRLGGQLDVTASIGGRFGAPEYTGAIRGRALSARHYLQGVSLSDGEVAIALDGTRARIERFEARGGTGSVRLEGDAVLGAEPQADLQLIAEGFQLLGRLDRRIVTSGQARLRLDRDSLALDGRFGVDEGLVDFTRSDAPSLSDDVVVTRAPNRVASGRAPDRAAAAAGAETPAGAASAPQPQVVRDTPLAMPKVALDLRVGLGEKLRVRGRGLDTRLRGDLRITSPGGRLAVNGSVSAVDGNYRAYGQKLVIDRGELVFNGPVGNPRLDIEATRPNIDVRVGVAISGTAASPRIRLFSEPEMSDLDKLSWLMLGRAGDELGSTDSALLQQAALALLAGEGPSASDQLFQTIGLDQISLRQSDGEVRETIVSLGKQLSQRWYVGYERSLNETAGNWQLIYRVARRFTLRAQSGLDNSLDAIWTWRWQ
jgi:translocation and assembly module TamB